MNRAIKYRAWDKKTRKMRAVDTIAFHFEEAAFDFDASRLPKVVNLWGTEIIGEHAPKPIILHREAKDVDLMQFTGLPDANQTEIYEHDILEEDAEWWEVRWSEDRAMFEAVAINGGNVTFALEEISNSAVVQGNIYENPELCS